MTGPLTGIRVLELAAIGPLPLAGMLLSDLGAEVVRVDRVHGTAADLGGARFDVHGRGRRSVGIDLKQPSGAELLLQLCERADVLMEGFRPGVMERLGVGPQECHARNPDLVYGRMTGWGRGGPLSATAGHDINYIAVAGALHPIGHADRPPVPPLNLVGDFGGGGTVLALGVVAALAARARGQADGQVVDAAMVDGTGLLMGVVQGQLASGRWTEERESNGLDGSAPWYRTYETADGRYVAVGAIEPKFWAELLDRLGIAGDPAFRDRYDRSGWPRMRERLIEVFATRTRDGWERHFAGSDACVAPVLTPREATAHPQALARAAYTDLEGVPHPAPAPRLSATPARVAGPAPTPGEHTDAVLAEWGVSEEEIATLRAAGTVGRSG
ncbi:CaiB/BaiF CoA transferase family protein [Pseudonocardia kunmingensis]|uniref:Alpha-methylacyl-CoA racemase n=1 Tax=Pseudonocardia kunmingensis TaxID=630975 RepID=A0A543DPW2_9PSEU|nr:CaiB/BaiF CoA-transferase family protein [Pseudonocardia kunmingensis]TQM11343.1 alpha-methylacyl-CoA racemase [Pseudonocardia kunmingensis]